MRRSIEQAFDSVLARIGAVPLLVVAALSIMLPGFVTLPPMDRDEPRFAQASKQMLETSDFVAIRFGNEARNKKPVGIHWLQAAAVLVAEAAGVGDARRQIWVYRLPSLFGAIAAILITNWTALALVSRRGAALAGLLVAATPLIGVEARLATTDAVLLATVTAAMGVLVRIYLADADTRHRMLGTVLAFWTSVGIGILIKGPITPLVVALAALTLSVKERSIGWLRTLQPARGLALCLMIILPWFVLIYIKTHGTFFTDAVGHDLLGKVAQGQESHGAPPGFYFATFWIASWPLAPFVALAAPTVWRNRREPGFAVLLAWIVPFWIILECVATKLVHYALPLYPPLAILVVLSAERATPVTYRAASGWVLFVLMSIVPAGVLAMIVAGQDRIWALGTLALGVAALAVAAAVALAFIARRYLRDRRPSAAAMAAVLAAVPLYGFVYGWLLLPSVARGLAVSPRLAQQAAADLGQRCPTPLYATVGSHEPSLMFATDTNLLMTDSVGAADFLADGTCRIAFVEARYERVFKAALEPTLDVTLSSRVEGFAVNGGRKLDIGIYVRP